jgi:ribosomal protein S18 acetylase RimI-like enzyme
LRRYRPAVVRELAEADLAWAEDLLTEAFGGRMQARRGELVDVLGLPGLVVERDGEPAGLLTYRWDDDGCELASIVVQEEHRGLGTELVEALVRKVDGRGRIWLVTSNDNVDALRFYQRRGFRLAELRPGAIDEARQKLKPEISRTGAYGIPIRDELELELPAEATVGA